MATKKRFSEQNEDKYSFGWDLPVKWEEGDISGEYLLPEVNIYPNNKFGDIARSQGLETARNWRKVKEGTTAGINRFASPVTEGAVTAVSFSPAGDAIDAMDFYNAAMKGDGMGMALAGLGFVPVVGNAAKKAGKYARKSLEKLGDKATDTFIYVSKKIDDSKDKFDRLKAPNVNKEGFEYTDNENDYKNFMDRLILGGLDKLGLENGITVNIKKNNSIFKGQRSENFRFSETEGDPSRNSLDVQDFILEKRPINGNSSKFDRKNVEVIVPEGDSDYSVKAAHEHGHLVDFIRHLFSRSFDDTVNGKIPGFNIKKVHPLLRDYFLKDNGDATEILQRVGQVKNYFKISDPNYNLTPKDWAYARKNYVKDTGIDNQMQKMFRAVKDPKAFLDWANPLVPAIGGAALVLPYSNSNNENKRRFDYEQ